MIHDFAPRAFSRAWVGYWLDFALYPLAAAIATAVYCRSAWWLAGIPAGFVLWTLTEYWTHRSILHRWFWHGTHELHHRLPAGYVVFDMWKLPLFFAACFLAMPPAIFVGFVLGYVWFLTLHHLLHHVDLREHTWLHRYAIWHGRHHKLGNVNYGITVNWWDRLFRTYR